MFDARRLFDQLVGSGAASGFAGGLAGGALANALSGNKNVRKVSGSALQIGGIALVGGLAYKAWQNYRQGSGAADDTGLVAPPDSSAFLPASNDKASASALSLLLARFAHRFGI